MKNYLMGQGLWDVISTGESAEAFLEENSEALKHLSNKKGKKFEATPDIEQGLVDAHQSVSEACQREVSFKMKNAKALHIIQLSCGRQIQEELCHFELAKDAWSHLSVVYGKTLKINLDELQQDDDDIVSVKHKELFRMVERGDPIEDIKIDQNVYDDITSTSARTLLHIAVNAGNLKNVEMLVREGRDEFVTKQDRYGDTALALAACYNAKIDIVKCMVDSKMGQMLLMKHNTNGELPVHMAAGKGHKKMTSFLYSETPGEVFKKDSRYRVLLLDRCITAEVFDVALKLLKLYPDDLFHEASYGEINNEERKDESNKFSTLVSLAKFKLHPNFPNRRFLQPAKYFIYNHLSLKQFEDNYGIPESEILEYIRLIYVDRSVHATSSSVKCWSAPGFLMVSKFLFLPIKLLDRLLHKFAYLLVKVFKYLDIFGTKEIYARKYTLYEVVGIIKYLIQNLKGFNGLGLRQASAHEAMLYAAQNGIITLINAMRNANPYLLAVTDNSGRGILWYAILNRRRYVFQLIYSLNGLEKEMIKYRTDSVDNNLLHMAALLVPSSIRGGRWGPAMQVQREIQWFKAVEEVVHPMCKEARNEDGKKPYDVFIESHEELVKAAEKWTKDTASCYIAVASLVLTVMFAAAFTIPGGNNQQIGTPISLDQNTFKMFLLADSVSIITSATSVLFFISILTSSCHAIDFLKVLPVKLITGLTLLLFSVCSMMVAFYAALNMILKQNQTGSRGVVLGPILSLGSVPVFILLASQIRFIWRILNCTMKNRIKG